MIVNPSLSSRAEILTSVREIGHLTANGSLSSRDGAANADIWIQPVGGKKTPAGEAIQVTDNEAEDDMVSWSPAGDRLLFVSQRTGGRTIWTVNPFNTTEPPAQVTTDADEFTGSVVNWSHDGREIVFSSGRTGNWDLFAVSAVGGEVRQITDRPDNDWDPDWSADGEWIAFNASPRGAGGDLWIVPAAGGGQARQLTSGAHGDYNPAWSPDGKWIAFCSARDGEWDIWIVPSAGGVPRNVTEGRFRAFRPRWSPDGRSVLFPASAAGKGELWSQPSEGGEPVKIASDVDIGVERVCGLSRRREVSPVRLQRPAKRGFSCPAPGSTRSQTGHRTAAKSHSHQTDQGMERTEPSWNIWRVAASGGETSYLMEGHSPQWSRDGSDVLHVWDGDVWTAPAAGGVPVTLVAINHDESQPRWSRDGSKILYTARQGHSQMDIWIADVGRVVDGIDSP